MTKITLGGRQFALEPLKLGQLRGLLDALDDLQGKTGGAVVDAAARVIQAGLVRTIPDLTVERVFDFEATMDEVTAAVAAILGAAGLTALGPRPTGEAMPAAGSGSPPAAQTANASPASTAPSPLVAAIPSPSSTA
jgi:hypothetical protein